MGEQINFMSNHDEIMHEIYLFMGEIYNFTHKHDVIMSNHDEIRHKIYLFMDEIYNFIHNHDVIMSNQNVFMSNHLKA